MVGHEADGVALIRVQSYPLNIAVEIPGRDVEVLSLPLIVVHPDRKSVRPFELRIDVHESLNVVLTVGQVSECLHGPTEIGPVDNSRLSRAKPLHVSAEEGLTRTSYLKTRLPRVCARNHHVGPTSQRLRPDRFGDHDLEAGIRRALGDRGNREAGEGDG